MRKLISALTVPTGLALLVIPVQTHDAPSSPGSTSSKAAMSPGQRIVLANEGAPPGATVTFTLDRSASNAVSANGPSSHAPGELILGQAVAADDGSFRSSVTIPPGTEPGDYALVSAADSRQLATIAVRVGTSGGGAIAGLALSGADVLPGVLAGAGLIVAGGLLLLGVQYRRSSVAQ